MEDVASELEAVLREHELEALTLEQAVAESGLSYSALEKALRQHRLPNAGTKGAPRIRRRDMPRKGATRAAEGGAFAARLRG